MKIILAAFVAAVSLLGADDKVESSAPKIIQPDVEVRESYLQVWAQYQTISAAWEKSLTAEQKSLQARLKDLVPEIQKQYTRLDAACRAKESPGLASDLLQKSGKFECLPKAPAPAANKDAPKK